MDSAGGVALGQTSRLFIADEFTSFLSRGAAMRTLMSWSRSACSTYFRMSF